MSEWGGFGVTKEAPPYLGGGRGILSITFPLEALNKQFKNGKKIVARTSQHNARLAELKKFN